jgi:hypothetical protein
MATLVDKAIECATLPADSSFGRGVLL